MKNILFLGCFFPKGIEEAIIRSSKGSVQMAANKLQWLLIDGFCNNKQNIDFLSAPSVSTFPLHNRALRVEQSSELYSGRTIKSISFLNLPFLNQAQIKRKLKAVLKKDGKSYDIVFFYAFSAYAYSILKWISKRYPRIKKVLYLVDLPMHMGLQKRNSPFRKSLRKKRTFQLFESRKYIDGFVLITKYMSDYLSFNGKKIVVEGMTYDRKPLDRASTIREKYRNIKKYTFLYTGAVTEQFGVVSLINQFIRVERDDIELIICGNGSDYAKCLSLSKNDKRIKMLGTVDNETAVKLQSDAFALINPMKDNEGISKYSFPSKMLEYFGSNSLVIGYKLSCYPEEYLDHILLVEEKKDFGLGDAILSALSLTPTTIVDRIKKRHSFMEKKSNTYQTRRIIDFMETL